MKYHYFKDNQLLGLIEEEEGIGFYLYIYNPETNKCIADHLQDTYELAQQQAWEDYKIPRNDWKNCK
ncbi:hypothetical protein [Terasakiella pusilla]|uniref:hypothetical protein n=1 Tax=Terasakiella pusilla TaxID=64973 RepID=UPI003AA8F90C